MTRQFICFLYLQEEGRTASRSHSRSHSRSSSRDSRASKYSSMSEEDFEAEARRRGWVKNAGEGSEATSRGETSSPGCFGDCFGGSKKKEAPPLETVYEDSDQNFEYRPHTQLQFEEPVPYRSVDNTPPSTPPSAR